MGTGFSKYVDQFKPFLMASLGNHEDSQVCLSAIGVVSDLCRAFEEHIFAMTDEIVAHLLQILQDPKVKRNVRPHALSCFGDIAIALNAKFLRYLETVAKWLNDAIEAANITNPEDYDQVEYVELLRESCLSGYVGIVQALRGGPEELRSVQPYVPSMIRLVSLVAVSSPAASDSLCAVACGLVGDLVNSFGTAILPFIDVDPVGQMLQRCRRSKHNKAKTLASWATREITRVKRQAAGTA
jgi:importin subunit beta-1